MSLILFFNYVFGGIAVFFAISLIFQPNRWIKEREELLHAKIAPYMYILSSLLVFTAVLSCWYRLYTPGRIGARYR